MKCSLLYLKKVFAEAVRERVRREILERNSYERLVDLELIKARGDIEQAKIDIQSVVSEKLDENPLHRWDEPVRNLAHNIINT